MSAPADPGARVRQLLDGIDRQGTSVEVRATAACAEAILALADAVERLAPPVPRPRHDDDLTGRVPHEHQWYETTRIGDPRRAWSCTRCPTGPTHAPGAVHVRQPGHHGEPDTCRVHGLPWPQCVPEADRG